MLWYESPEARNLQAGKYLLIPHRATYLQYYLCFWFAALYHVSDFRTSLATLERHFE